jgi:hypothetical protein
MNPRIAWFSSAIALLWIAEAAQSLGAEPRRAEPALHVGEPGIITVSLTLKLRTGGQLTGAVLDHDEHAIVILSKDTPYVFAWSELDPSTALGAKRTLLAKERGSTEHFSADDYFHLGMFGLRTGRNDLAANEFDQAKRLDPKLAPRIQEAYAQFRREADSKRADQRGDQNARDEPQDGEDLGASNAVRADVPSFEQLPPPSNQVRADVREAN